jgi:RNA polymerase sigma-70 factor (ECF subfamily)
MVPADEASALFSAYHDRIYRYVLSLVHNPSEAEDLAQDTFLRAYSHRDSLRDPNAVRGWLYRIATHVCLDRLRQRVVQVSMDSEEGERGMAFIRADTPSALEITEGEETGACVQRCLDFLSDSYRAVILLHEAHSLTAPEIADLLGESVGTIKIRLHRASEAPGDHASRLCCVAKYQRCTMLPAKNIRGNI